MPINRDLVKLAAAVDALRTAPLFDKPQHAEAVGREALAALDDIYTRLKRIEHERS